MEHMEAVVTTAEAELDEALATAIRQLITGAMGALDADAKRSFPAGAQAGS